MDTKAAEQAVRDADTQWSKAAAARDLTTVLAYYTDDAVVMPPNDAMIMDKPSLRKAWTAMLVPGTEISWIAGKVVAASSGDMVFDVGTYTQITRHGKGLPVTDRGKYLAVWKKQADGRWKAIADTWNSDLPAKKAR